MANNRKTTKGRKHDQNYKQIVMTAPSRLLVEHYLTSKDKRLISQPGLKKVDKDLIWAKYGKNRYKVNPDSHPCRNKIGGLKIIQHT